MRQKIRDLEKENRSLKRENSALKKYSHMYQEWVAEGNDLEQDEPEIEIVKNNQTCSDCARGILTEFEIMPGKVFQTCNICDYRRKKE